jgi:hypothetical protein
MAVIIKIINKPIINIILNGQGGELREGASVTNCVKGLGKIKSYDSNIGVGG